MLSEVRFGSYLAYSPRGSSDVSKRSRLVRDAVKYWRQDLIDRIVTALRTSFPENGLAAVLGPEVVLVPVPRRAPLVAGGLWPSSRLCEALVAAGLGAEVLPALERTAAVPKSAFAAPGERPTAMRHYETIDVSAVLTSRDRVTVVDDIITKGNTMLGAASRLSDQLTNADLGGFALVRTRGLVPEIDEIVDPVVGSIRRSGASAIREP